MKKAEAQALRRALDVLSARDGRGRPRAVGDALKEIEGGSGRSRIGAWVHGVVRARRALHAVVGAVARRALKDRPPRLVAALELGAWRVLWGAEAPAGVAAELSSVIEGGRKVQDLVRRVVEGSAAAVAERLGDGEVALDPALLDGRRDDILPLGPGRAVRLGKPLLETSRRAAPARLGIPHSLPDALVEAWIARHGEATALSLCLASNAPPPLFARTNPLRTTREALLEALAKEGVAAQPVALVPGALRLDSSRGAFRRSTPWREGHLTIQDLTAQRAAPLLAPRPGERVLDLCAAPGTKTTALAELALDQASILACDKSPRRLHRVEQNAERLGLTSIRTRAHDGRNPGELAALGPFDAILVDAPCSNTGVLRRRPEARWRFDARSQRRLARDQAALLATAASLLAPGGRLVWSVCSIEPEEGELLLRDARPGRLELVEQALHLPTIGGGDGGFLGLLRRT